MTQPDTGKGFFSPGSISEGMVKPVAPLRSEGVVPIEGVAPMSLAYADGSFGMEAEERKMGFPSNCAPCTAARSAATAAAWAGAISPGGWRGAICGCHLVPPCCPPWR